MKDFQKKAKQVLDRLADSKVVIKAKEIGKVIKQEAPYVLEDKLPPYATAHQLAQNLYYQNLDNTVFVQQEGFVKDPQIVMFFDEQMDELSRKRFFNKLKKDMAWHGFEVAKSETEKWKYIFDNGNISHEVVITDHKEMSSFAKKENHFLQVL